MSSNRVTDFSIIFVAELTTGSDLCTGSNHEATIVVARNSLARDSMWIETKKDAETIMLIR